HCTVLIESVRPLIRHFDQRAVVGQVIAPRFRLAVGCVRPLCLRLFLPRRGGWWLPPRGRWWGGNLCSFVVPRLDRVAVFQPRLDPSNRRGGIRGLEHKTCWRRLEAVGRGVGRAVGRRRKCLVGGGGRLMGALLGTLVGIPWKWDDSRWFLSFGLDNSGPHF